MRLSSLSFFLGLFIVLVYVVVFVDLRAMLAHLERRLSGIPWAGRQAARRQVVPLLTPVCVSSRQTPAPVITREHLTGYDYDFGYG